MDKWRGKRANIYFGNEELFKKLNKEHNKSELINSLLEDYYNKDLEFLEQQKQQLTEQQTIIQMKIDNLLKTREKVRKIKSEENRKLQEIEERKYFNDELVRLWRNNKITDKIYYKICDIKDLNKKIEELKNMFTIKQTEAMEMFWKAGYFIAEDLNIIYSSETARKECISRLLKLGVIEEANFKFKINRERFLELQEWY